METKIGARANLTVKTIAQVRAIQPVKTIGRVRKERI